MLAMAKKMKSTKKHRFKYAQAPGAPVEPAMAAAAVPASAGARVAPAGTAVAVGRDFSYVTVDLRRLGILALSLIMLELVLWYLMAHTSLGAVIYNAIQV